MDANNRNRLDSLISRIPANIFDSIRKYQDSSIDRLDTLLWGKGVGFSLVDSLTDTVNILRFQIDPLAVPFDLPYRLDNMTFGSDFENLGYGDTSCDFI